MLVIKLFLNDTPIDEIHIQRVSGNVGGWCEYAVRQPAIAGTVLHHYDSGAVALAATVLSALAEAEYGGRDEAEQP